MLRFFLGLVLIIASALSFHNDYDIVGWTLLALGLIVWFLRIAGEIIEGCADAID